MHEGAALLVEAAQDAVAAQHDIDLGAQPVEDAGEFDGDVARANDGDVLGQLGKVEGVARRDRELAARDRRNHRMAAGGDQDLLGRNGFLADLDRVAVHKAAAAHMQLHARPLEQAQVERVQPVDFLVHVVAQRRP